MIYKLPNASRRRALRLRVIDVFEKLPKADLFTTVGWGTHTQTFLLLLVSYNTLASAHALRLHLGLLRRAKSNR